MYIHTEGVMELAGIVYKPNICLFFILRLEYISTNIDKKFYKKDETEENYKLYVNWYNYLVPV